MQGLQRTWTGSFKCVWTGQTMPWDSQVMTRSKRLPCLRQLFQPAPFRQSYQAKNELQRGRTAGLCCTQPKGQGHQWPKVHGQHKRAGVWGHQKYLVAKGCPDIWRALPAGLRRQPSTKLFLIVSMPSNKSWGNISHDSGNQKAIIWVTNCVWKTPVMNAAHNSLMWASTEIQRATCTQEQNPHHTKVQDLLPYSSGMNSPVWHYRCFKFLGRSAVPPLLYAAAIFPAPEFQEPISLCTPPYLVSLEAVIKAHPG